MNILDENIAEGQYKLLRSWRIAVRQIGLDAGYSGMTDKAVLSLLHHLRAGTFFTQDRFFYRRELCHPRYCLVFLDVEKSEIAEYTKRFLRHPGFRTRAKRTGRAVRVSGGGLRYWERHSTKPRRVDWDQ